MLGQKGITDQLTVTLSKPLNTIFVIPFYFISLLHLCLRSTNRFFRSCPIQIWPMALESPIQPCCGGVEVFTTSWPALSKCQVLYVCDLCFDVLLSFFLYCLSVTGLVKGHYNLEGEPAMHLGRIKKLYCFMFQRVNSSAKCLFGLHVHTYMST